MEIEEKVFQCICNAVDTVNAELSQNQKIAKSIDTNLYGKNATLDSISLVNLIVGVEEIISDEFEVSITLADDRAMSQSKNPFQSIRSLVDYILLLLNEHEPKIE
jgi:acyl carrier protein